MKTSTTADDSLRNTIVVVAGPSDVKTTNNQTLRWFPPLLGEETKPLFLQYLSILIV
jgi:hypothetical protein